MSESSEEIMSRVRAALGPDLLESVLAAGRALPSGWQERSAHEGLRYLRRKRGFTQAELARKAGVAQSQVSKIEAGGDALLSTWVRLYAAMGFELRLVPISRPGEPRALLL